MVPTELLDLPTYGFTCSNVLRLLLAPFSLCSSFVVVFRCQNTSGNGRTGTGATGGCGGGGRGEGRVPARALGSLCACSYRAPPCTSPTRATRAPSLGPARARLNAWGAGFLPHCGLEWSCGRLVVCLASRGIVSTPLRHARSPLTPRPITAHPFAPSLPRRNYSINHA